MEMCDRECMFGDIYLLTKHNQLKGGRKKLVSETDASAKEG